MNMSHPKDKDSSSNYNAILAPIVNYLQSIDTWHEYIVFITIILSLLLGLDLFSNNGTIIKLLFQPISKTRNLPYKREERDYLTSINLRHPGANLGIIPCRSPVPATHRVLKVLGGDGEMCRVLIININASQEAIRQSEDYFCTSRRDN